MVHSNAHFKVSLIFILILSPGILTAQDKHSLGALEEPPGFKLGAQAAASWTLQDEYMEPSNEFRVNRARIKLSWSQWDLVRAVIKVEAKELFGGDLDNSILRDLYIRIQPFYWLGVRIGQFKKPFSRIALTSWTKFRFVKRGIGNDYITEHLMYGDRDIGAMLEGRIAKSINLDYAIGVFNGMGMNAYETGLNGSKDIVGRLETEPLKWLEIGASASLKFIEREDLPGFVDQSMFPRVDEEQYPNGYTATDFMNEHEWMTGISWMTGLDVGFKPGKWRIIGEGMLGKNWWFQKYPYVWSAALLVSYKAKLGRWNSISIEPAIKGETLSFLTTGMDQWRSLMWQLTPGVNLHLGKNVRLMVNGEFIFTNGTEADIDGSRREGLWPNEYPGNWSDSKKLIVQLGFDI